MTGALHAGRRAGQARHDRSRRRCPAAARSCGSRSTDQGADGIYPHEKMEVYAIGLPQPVGRRLRARRAPSSRTRWRSPTTAPTISATAASPTAPEKLCIVTEKGQDAGFPDKEGFGFVTNKRFGWDAYRGNPVDRPLPATSTSARSRSSRRCCPTASSSTSTACAACR